MTTELTTLKDSMARLDDIAENSALLSSPGAPFTQAITMAGAMLDIRAALTDEVMNQAVMPLMNSKLGFRTDKDPNRPVWNKREGKMIAPEPYALGVVRECLIEATLRGLPPVGNCWNIISGQSYTTKEGFWYLIGKRVNGLTDFKISVGVPKMIRPAGDQRNASDDEAKGALVTCFATWKLNSKEDRCEREIPIRVNAMMGADAIMGKAERKILAAAYSQITGTTLGDADVGDVDLGGGDHHMRDATPKHAGPVDATVNPFEVQRSPAAGESALPPRDEMTTAIRTAIQAAGMKNGEAAAIFHEAGLLAGTTLQEASDPELFAMMNRLDLIPPKKQEAPASPVEPKETQPEPPTKTAVVRKEEALGSIEESLKTGFDEVITLPQFEAMLRKQSLLSATGTLKGKHVDQIENIAASVVSIVETDRQNGGDE